jgi:hypothetical protein
MIENGKMKYSFTAPLYFFAILLLISGCAGMSAQSEGEIDEGAAESVPYYANDFNDIMVPNELKWDREGSMAIKTESYAGGVLKFVGRVEVNSLSDFFINTMTKNKWKLVGSAKYKNVLLAFTKPNKTAMVMILESSDISRKTTVHIYLTDDRVSSDKGYNPFAGESVR